MIREGMCMQVLWRDGWTEGHNRRAEPDLHWDVVEVHFARK